MLTVGMFYGQEYYTLRCLYTVIYLLNALYLRYSYHYVHLFFLFSSSMFHWKLSTFQGTLSHYLIYITIHIWLIYLQGKKYCNGVNSLNGGISSTSYRKWILRMAQFNITEPFLFLIPRTCTKYGAKLHFWLHFWILR